QAPPYVGRGSSVTSFVADEADADLPLAFARFVVDTFGRQGEERNLQPDLFRRHALVDHHLIDGQRAFGRDSRVDRTVADVVGRAFDDHEPDPRVALDDPGKGGDPRA